MTTAPRRRRASRPDLRRMERGIRTFLEGGGLAPLRGDLGRTPLRSARAWRDFLLAGYREEPGRLLAPLRSSTSRDLVAVRDIDFVSTCAHHLLPFFGKVHVAYLPEGRITGISRLAALVACLSRRLQIQEDLTREIAERLQASLAPRGVACLVEAAHLCMTARGGRPSGGKVVTASFTGCYESDRRLRSQALSLLGAAPRPGARARRR